MDPGKQRQLRDVLLKHDTLFDGVLKTFPGQPMRIDLIPFDWLGYWLTPKGIKPWTKKVDAILKMKLPSNATELRTFLGMITYYRDMWPRRSHILAPFTALSGLPEKAKINLTTELDLAFKGVKAIIVQDVLTYDLSKPQ